MVLSVDAILEVAGGKRVFYPLFPRNGVLLKGVYEGLQRLGRCVVGVAARGRRDEDRWGTRWSVDFFSSEEGDAGARELLFISPCSVQIARSNPSPSSSVSFVAPLFARASELFLLFSRRLSFFQLLSPFKKFFSECRMLDLESRITQSWQTRN